jgi:hypothetical protein
MPQLADCRLPGNSEQKLQKYGLLWCNIVQQFCGSDAFIPPARPLPDSIRAVSRIIDHSEFGLHLDKMVCCCKRPKIVLFWVQILVIVLILIKQGEALYGGLKAVRAQIAFETGSTMCVAQKASAQTNQLAHSLAFIAHVILSSSNIGFF